MNSINDRISVNEILITDEKLDKKSLLSIIAQEVSKKANINEKEIYKALLSREKLSSTGFGNGIAIPHCQLEGINDFHLGIICHKSGIDFNSLDGKPAHIFFYIIGNKENKNEHIAILSSASKLLSKKEIYDNMLNATSSQVIKYELQKSSLESTAQIQTTDRMLFQIATADEALYNEFLEIALSLEIENMVVFDAQSPSNDLYKLPIFSSFWTDRDENNRKIIFITVEKGLANNLIREFSLITGIEDLESKYVMNVIPLYFSAGKLGI